MLLLKNATRRQHGIAGPQKGWQERTSTSPEQIISAAGAPCLAKVPGFDLCLFRRFHLAFLFS
jgi:hypothetical protein